MTSQKDEENIEGVVVEESEQQLLSCRSGALLLLSDPCSNMGVGQSKAGNTDAVNTCDIHHIRLHVNTSNGNEKKDTNKRENQGSWKVLDVCLESTGACLSLEAGILLFLTHNCLAGTFIHYVGSMTKLNGFR